ncbi:alpha-(1,3)-fucosyltransferase fut-5-like [Mercenaria mercenaria]|uniref:alpha-(1,3)-fucosyltransferase fut-5-like n=1 Tax=Mercenaria mercenaria TaxID=6596 RepID=UPI00234E4BE4|nr:alpha-(1,3)-fucosyltransferase fut-5-like [Mercenaria mercenaria]
MPYISYGARFRGLFVVLALITTLLLCYVCNTFPDVFFGANVLSKENILKHRTAELTNKVNAKELSWSNVQDLKDGRVDGNKDETRWKMNSPYIDKKFHLNTTGVVKNKTILWWNSPGWLKNWFADFNMDQCEYKNCRVSFNLRDFQRSDAVVYSLVDTGMGYKPPVPPNMRNPDQAWIFFTLESPVHVKMAKREFMNPHWQNVFNWSWTYRTDADIFHPYGNLVTKEIVPKRNYSEIFRRKTKMAAWAVSHCITYSRREKYENLLNKYAKVDIYGSCGLASPPNLKKFINNNYKFYLGFENSLCNEYMTEKFFNYYKMDLITIVRGKGDYNKYLPEGSFINTADFPSVKALAKFMHKLGSNKEEYIKYLKVKDRYKVYERDFMYRDAACSVCEKLNNLEKNRKTYKNVSNWLGSCYAVNDVKESK